MKKSVLALIMTATAALAPAAPASAEPFIGEIRSFGFNFCPRNWAEANGALLAVTSNDALFSLYGTIYGGDGRTTFALPDLRGRVPINSGQGLGLQDRRLGAKFGSETTQHTIATMPNHTHGVVGNLTARMQASTTTASSPDPTGNFIGTFASGGGAYTTDATTLVPMAAGDIEVNVDATQLGNTGGNIPAQNMAPSLVTRYCVALFGIYPSRS